MNFVEVFAGCGGLSSGLIRAGWNPLLLVDNDKNCIETLKANHTGCDVLLKDARELNLTDKKGRVDLLAGGVPCQAFSQAGKRKGLEDNRGNLFFEFFRFIDECEPKCFLIENVVGLLTHEKGKTFETIINTLKSKGYVVSHKIMNAHDYGVAQKRKRVIIIGSKKKEFEFPEPDKYKPVLSDALKDVPESCGVKYPKEKENVMRQVPPGGCWVDLPDDVKVSYMGNSIHSGGGKRGMARRMAWNEPCLTLTTSPCQKQTERCHPSETRPFTVREYARIQSFDDGYMFRGSTASQYRQIGNAVPVELAYRIGASLKKQWMSLSLS